MGALRVLHAPTEIAGQLEAAKAKIVSGEVKVAATHKDAKALPGFPRNLQAKDE